MADRLVEGVGVLQDERAADEIHDSGVVWLPVTPLVVVARLLVDAPALLDLLADLARIRSGTRLVRTSEQRLRPVARRDGIDD